MKTIYFYCFISAELPANANPSVLEVAGFPANANPSVLEVAEFPANVNPSVLEAAGFPANANPNGLKVAGFLYNKKFNSIYKLKTMFYVKNWKSGSPTNAVRYCEQSKAIQFLILNWGKKSYFCKLK
jgi:hypothetical protein